MNLPPWSYSMLEMYSQCPKKAFHKYILKEKEPESAAMREGNLFDKAAEARIKNGTPFPPEYQKHEALAGSLAASPGKKYTQLKLGITKDFKPCPFFDKDVWGRGALDVGLINYPKAIVADWKTGKNNEGRPFYTGLQLKIFTLLVFKHFPRVDAVTAFNIYLQEGRPGNPVAYSRADEATLWREVLGKVLTVEKAFKQMEWPACQGPLCSWCPVLTCNFNPKGGSYNAA